ncbi:fumarylacetoacetase [Streptomonospora litoralis]|uniref:fumarylacetoacetase n=1 Tax=Streptomonospora litoralis TaxID=2498135 RepID=A0A4P6Q0J4_9ACTN|nr:fumarylacetoacetase [Streptomonospora litoralis]QBI53590.1 Fumarylacetoacetate (FAA) hydrolase family protein [Streptomonospora litoralis]
MPAPTTWLDVAADDPFGPATLPYGVFSSSDGRPPRVGVAIGAWVLDLGAAARELDAPFADAVDAPALNPLLAAGPATWREVRETLTAWLADPAYEGALRPHLADRARVRLHLPFAVGDYVDFYSSEHHATNLGRILRPNQEPLTPNWKHLPIGYHGRSGTVVVSGTEIVRPMGQRKPPSAAEPDFGPSARLDIEAEVGFVVGSPAPLGTPVPVADFAEHVFGVFLVNDWSARDLQAWETVPLGPFLGKSFATSVSPWVVPLSALEAARVEPPARGPEPLPYLRDADGQPWGLDLRLEVRLNGHTVARPPFAAMYWTPAQQLAHLTVNGASLRTGDIYASGTVSGPGAGEQGSLIELSWNGAEPLELPDGSTRTFLRDGDTVSITASAPGAGGATIGFGEVAGRVLPAEG